VKNKIIYPVLMCVVSLVVGAVFMQCWNAPVTFVSRSELAEAKAALQNEDKRLQQEKLDKETHLAYVQQEFEFRKEREKKEDEYKQLIAKQQDVQTNHIMELNRQILRNKK
jgi:cell division protein FtsL